MARRLTLVTVPPEVPAAAASGDGIPLSPAPSKPAAVAAIPLAPAAPSPAIAVFLAEFGSRLRYLVEQHCRGNQGLDPDDIEQEARIRLWRALERDRNGMLPASYIQRVVVSTVVDALRRAAARPAEPLPEDKDGVEPVGDERPGPDNCAVDRQQVEVLQRCLARLTQRRRLPVELHLQGYTLAEIAELVGLTSEAARKLIERGLKDVRALLRAQGVDDDD